MHADEMGHWPAFLFTGTYTDLRQLKLQVDFDVCGLSDSRGLTRILEEHSRHLKSVRLRPISLRLWIAERDLGEQAFGNWMTCNMSNPVVLRDLESLNLRTPCTSSDFDLMTVYLERSAETLTKLTLAESYLRFEQIETVVKIFSPRGILKILTIEVMTMSPQLIDLLATELPNLHVLKLEVQNISGCGEASHGFRDDTQTVTRLLTLIDTIDTNTGIKVIFRKEMEMRTYPNWKLCNIGIKKSGCDALLLKIMAASVPSIQSFYGPGTMDIA
jgi:hypothetical protein